jgi:large subunit ribosomal protein L4
MAEENKKTETIKEHPELVSKVVRVVLSNKRKASAKTKKRDEVSGGGRKPFRQKGTGRARAGSNRSPLWRSGGVVFGPTGDQNYKLSINKKEALTARKEAYETKKADIVTVEAGKITKTKEAALLLKKNNISGKVLVMADDISLKRYFRNIADLKFLTTGNENVYDILRANKIVILATKKQETVKAGEKK